MTQTLDISFEGKGEVKGFLFTQVVKGEKSYIYEVKFNNSRHYEVFKRKETPLLVDFEKRLYSETEFKEMYPKAKDFGVWAWSFLNKENAIEKFNLLNNN